MELSANKYVRFRDAGMAPWEKIFATRPDLLSGIARTHTVDLELAT